MEGRRERGGEGRGDEEGGRDAKKRDGDKQINRRRMREKSPKLAGSPPGPASSAAGKKPQGLSGRGRQPLN